MRRPPGNPYYGLDRMLFEIAEDWFEAEQEDDPSLGDEEFPAYYLDLLFDLGRAVDRETTRAVAAARQPPLELSWQRVARLLRMTKQAAYKRYHTVRGVP